MKKILLFLLVIIITASLILSSCGSKSESVSTVSGATDDEANYPTPVEETFVESDKGTGMRYSYTLDRYTTAFNTMYTSLGGSLKDFPYKKWKKIKSDYSDGVVYDYYYLKSGIIKLTATVDSRNLYLSNVGCGVTQKDFSESPNIEQKVMTICGIIAAVAGGYSSGDVTFFGNLFVDTISSPDHCFWYNNSIYLYENDKSSDGKKTMLFRTMPAKANYEQDWNLVDYKKYWLG